MAFDFKKAFNSQVKVANKLNQGLNKIIGKDVFGEVKELEDPRKFAPYESFPEYTELEPVDWPLLEGERQEFNFAGNTISFPKELDTCMRYRKYFKEAAEFYAARFAFKYQHCVEDFDTLFFARLLEPAMPEKPYISRLFGVALIFLQELCLPALAFGVRKRKNIVHNVRGSDL